MLGMMHKAPRLRPKEKMMAKNGTVARVTVMPDCDICQHVPDDMDSVQPARKATHDVKTIHGSWANVCDPHRKTYALYRDLGLGMGQKLELIT